MPQLVPEFIVRQTRPAGRFRGAALRVDVSGFTAATNALMDRGDEAAEAVADVMEAIFTPLVDAVEARRGFVATFSGDGFTAVFPEDAGRAEDAGRRAVAAALAMRDHLAAFPTQETRYGRFSFSARFGVGRGEVRWRVLHPEGGAGGEGADGLTAAWYFDGTAIDAAVRAEGRAPRGAVVLAGDLPGRAGGLTARPLDGDGLVVVEGLAAPVPGGAPPPAPAPAGVERFVPPAVLAHFARGEFRPVLSVFVNLPGPEAAERLPGFMRQVFALQARHGGYLNKIEFGDKGCTLLLFWGAPTSRENDLAAGLDFLLELRARSAAPFRAGAVYRRVFAGRVGSGRRAEYTCYGDGVNLAARLMAAAPVGAVWTDDALARRAAAAFDFADRGGHALKGFAEPVPLRELAGRRAAAEGAFYAHELVGREEEGERLSAFLRPLLEPGAARWAGVLAVLGEAGLGKSRLVHETLARPEIAERVQVFTAQSDQVLRQPFHPFGYWLRRYFGQSAASTEAENRATFDARLDALVAATPDAPLRAELDRLRSILAALVDLYWDGSLYAELEPRSRHENTLIALQQLLRAEARRRPVVLLLEDSHWLDDASRRALAELARSLTDVPVAIVAVARPQPPDRSTLAGIPHQALELDALAADELARLAGALLGGPPGPGLLALLTRRSEGNPFFAEQIVGYLRDEDALERGDGAWELKGGAGTAVLPDDLRLLFIARLDRLAASLREVVQAASILGREFGVHALSGMLRDEPLVLRHLARGEDERVWSALGQLRYLFRHALLRDAAYEMQLVARRRELHRLAAAALEALHADQPAPHHAEIAYHYETAFRQGVAEVRESAFRHLRLAGDRAASRFENAAAVDFLSRALALADGEDAEFELTLQREDVLHLVGDRAAQLADLERLEALAAARARPRERATVALRRARHAMETGQYRAAAELTGEARRIAGEAGDRVLEGEALAAAAKLDRLQGHAQEGLALFREALAVARDAGDTDAERNRLIGAGACAELLGDYREAEALYEEALVLARADADRRDEAHILHNLGTTAFRLADLARATDLLDQALVLRRATGDRAGEAATLYTLAIVVHVQADYPRCLEHLERSLALRVAVHDRRGEADDLRLMAMAWASMGHYDNAAHHHRRSLEVGREIENERGVAISLHNLGNLEARFGRFGVAQRLYGEAEPTMRAMRYRQGIANLYECHAWVASARGDFPEAARFCERSLEIAREIGDRRGQASVLGHLSEALCELGRLAEAEEALREALELGRQVDAAPLTTALQAHAARLCLARGDADAARAAVLPVLERMDGDFRLPGGPYEVYLACYEALRAAADPRAGRVLEAACEGLREQATTVSDGETRRAFLEDVRWNRRIGELWRERLAGGGAPA